MPFEIPRPNEGQPKRPNEELIPKENVEKNPVPDQEKSLPGAEIVNPSDKEVFDPKEEVVGDRVNLKKKLKESMEDGQLELFEDLLNQAREKELINAREYDQKQRQLFGILREKKDWDGMKRIIEATEDFDSQAGRIKNFEKVSGLKYDGVRLEESFIESQEDINIVDTASFRKALKAGHIEIAEQWLAINESRYDEKALGHRRDELKKAKEKF